MNPNIFSRKYPKDPKSGKTLMVTDMQGHHLNRITKEHASEYSYLLGGVIKRIKERIAYHMDIGGNVFLIQDLEGETIPELTTVLPEARILKKRTDGLLHHYNENRNKILEILRKSCVTETEITGVNTTSCILETLITLLRSGFDAKVRLDCTLSNYDKSDFLEDNSMRDIINAYGEENGHLPYIITSKIDMFLGYLDDLLHFNFGYSLRKRSFVPYLEYPGIDLMNADGDLLSKTLLDLNY